MNGPALAGPALADSALDVVVPDDADLSPAAIANTAGLTAEDLAAFSALVTRLRALSPDHPLRLRAERVAESFARDGRRTRRLGRRADQSRADARINDATVLGAADRRMDAPMPDPAEPSPGKFGRARHCYVCKQPYRRADVFYHRLCPSCAQANFARRAAGTDLSGRRVLLTGGRVKIGFQLALMMLRDGADLIVTSRFPQDTIQRFTAAPGSAHWLDRLTVVGIDLRDPRQVIGFCDDLLASGRGLDIVVNNAAQTVRRPADAYALLAAGELRALAAAGNGSGPGTATSPTGPVPVLLAPGYQPMAVPAALPSALRAPAELTGVNELVGLPSAPYPLSAAPPSPAIALRETDEAGLLPDLAPENSWSARLGELDPAELLETHLVNALAPALLCDRLLPLLDASAFPRRYIVNVTAVEGRFTVRNKTSGHPHTNMAKAALNMLTRTSAADLAERGIYLCAVDTGWITDENPAPKRERMAEAGFRTPLDIVDGAARVYDPILRGEAGDPVFGVFLKDYKEAAW
ncbi:MAG TPA: SDR family oxidoreductase [Actinocrinis sp.]|nr:SDR family oxidoreductase [Actinocrinis sp.]